MLPITGSHCFGIQWFRKRETIPFHKILKNITSLLANFSCASVHKSLQYVPPGIVLPCSKKCRQTILICPKNVKSAFDIWFFLSNSATYFLTVIYETHRSRRFLPYIESINRHSNAENISHYYWQQNDRTSILANVLYSTLNEINYLRRFNLHFSSGSFR